MTPSLAALKTRLTEAPGKEIRAQLCRIVPHLSLGPSPDWLFTSGRPNRYNPAGVHCVYFGETQEVARAEYDGYWKGLADGKQPVTVFHAEVNLKAVLDLCDAKTMKKLRLTPRDLQANWRRCTAPVVTQLLGKAVSDMNLFSAIRYPSRASRDFGFDGANMVIFRRCVHPPDSVQIIGPGGKMLQKWG